MLAAEPAAIELGSTPPAARPEFEVHLDIFEGPFDLLLSLIAKRRLDLTLIALSQVTDEFIGFIRSRGDDWDLDQASDFLVVAATLLDLKVARLLPSADGEDEDDLALLEARDLLFARLLQYRAYKQVAALFAQRIADAGRRFPRTVAMEPWVASLRPEVVLGVNAEQLAAIASFAERARPLSVVDVGHLIAPVVSVREQAAVLAERLRSSRVATFRALTADCGDLMHVVGRFLAALELYREGLVAFEQLVPLGELHIRWVGGDAEPEVLLATIDEEYEPVAQDA